MYKKIVLFMLILFSFSSILLAQDKNQKKSELKISTGISKKGDYSFGPGFRVDECAECFEWMKKNQKLIQSELKQAAKKLPAFSYSYYVLVNEYSMLHEFYRRNSHLSFKPVPDGGEGEPVPMPEDVWNWFYKERREIFEILKAQLDAMDVEDDAPPEVDHRWNYCRQVKAECELARECVAGYLENEPQTDAEWEEYMSCLEKLLDCADSRDYCKDYW